jgi:hypothetical protein
VLLVLLSLVPFVAAGVVLMLSVLLGAAVAGLVVVSPEVAAGVFRGPSPRSPAAAPPADD